MDDPWRRYRVHVALANPNASPIIESVPRFLYPSPVCQSFEKEWKITNVPRARVTRLEVAAMNKER